VLGNAAISKCVSLVFAGGDTMAPSVLYARLCHAFSSVMHTTPYLFAVSTPQKDKLFLRPEQVLSLNSC